MKRVLFVASECVPFIKTGGLADVIGALPKMMNRNEYDIRVFLPFYTCIPQELRDEAEFVTHFYMNYTGRDEYVGIKQMLYEGIQFYFIDNEYYFSGMTPYTNIYDDVWKFSFFCKAVLYSLPKVDFKPDIIHCHDWQTSLMPVYIKIDLASYMFYQKIKTVLTIHNLEFKGCCRMEVLRTILGYSDALINNGNFELDGGGSMLKAGIVYADYISTVSETYAKEIQTHYYGENLAELLISRSDSLRGIINGVDYGIYDPVHDKFLVERYNIENVKENKAKNKEELQRRFGVEVNKDKFVVGFISRLTEQKGIDLIQQVMNEICMEDIQFFVLGTGERRYEDRFRQFASQYPQNVVANICYSEELAHMMYAGCDALLMPSRFEPCGLCQLMSFRYGTIPIVRETGGLKDTVIDYNKNEQEGNGFSFAQYNSYDMLYAIRHAKIIFTAYKDLWLEMMKRGMALDYSWSASTRKYEKLYDEILES
ncbi:MAG: glycogen synthase [Lachnospiraceae bacterium]|nr:glycogen synthase [Lachnospiraceae bacterium]